MITHNNRTIGILGGMGPDASARLYQLIIDMARVNYGAKENHEYPEIILHSIPIPDFITREENIKVAQKMLIRRVNKLSRLPISHLCIACNTVHIFLDDLKDIISAKFVSMPEEVVNQIIEKKYRKVCLLATPSTIKYRIYQDLFEKRGIEYNLPHGKYLTNLGEIISRIVEGDIIGTTDEIVKITDAVTGDSEAVILGCTELPLVFPHKYPIPVLDSTKILAQALLKRYYMNKENL